MKKRVTLRQIRMRIIGVIGFCGLICIGAIITLAILSNDQDAMNIAMQGLITIATALWITGLVGGVIGYYFTASETGDGLENGEKFEKGN